LGTPVTQIQLVNAINKAYNINLYYKSISVESFKKQRQAELGEFIGLIIGGIYEGIRTGKFDIESDFMKVAKRTHKSLDAMINEFLSKNKKNN